MKFYPQSKDGITPQIKAAGPEDEFVLTGPIGKGFNSNEVELKGRHVIIVGGTGVLPFVDLFAYLARKLLAEQPEHSQVFPGEMFDDSLDDCGFNVYAFYPDIKSAVAFDF